ncbi:hypothetical protein OFM39_30300, partial [Escherichia coli]|nr:hypothetical protein [Escherichia coli]
GVGTNLYIGTTHDKASPFTIFIALEKLKHFLILFLILNLHVCATKPQRSPRFAPLLLPALCGAYALINCREIERFGRLIGCWNSLVLV